MNRLRNAYSWAARIDTALGLAERLVVIGGVGVALALAVWGLLGGDLLRLIGLGLLITWSSLAVAVLFDRLAHRYRRVSLTGIELRPSRIDATRLRPPGTPDVLLHPTPDADIPIYYRGDAPYWIAGVRAEPGRTVYTFERKAREMVETGLWGYGPRPDVKPVHRVDPHAPTGGGNQRSCVCGWRGSIVEFESHKLAAERAGR